MIENIQSAGANSTSAAEFYGELCSHADKIMETIKRHFDNEEVQVCFLVDTSMFLGMFGSWCQVMQQTEKKKKSCPLCILNGNKPFI